MALIEEIKGLDKNGAVDWANRHFGSKSAARIKGMFYGVMIADDVL